MILGFDVSHFQQGTNFAAAKSAGRDFVVLKATEGTTYADPTFAANRKAAHAAGLIVGAYHFARAGNAAAEAAWFLRTVGTLQAGEFLVLDWEVPAPAGGAPAWCKAWLDAVAKATGINPLIYMNSSAASGSNWSAVATTYGLWLAKYDGTPAAQNAVPYWGVPAMKQYSDAGSVPGVAGTCDVNAFYGTRDQLLAYGYHQGADMPLTPADVNLILDTPITRGGGVAGQTSLRSMTAWLDANLNMLRSGINDVHDRAMGMLQQRYYVTSPDGTVTPAVANAPGAQPAAVLDTLDGNWLVQQVRAQESPTIDEAKLAAALLADEASVAKLGDAIAAGLAKRVGNG